MQSQQSIPEPVSNTGVAKLALRDQLLTARRRRPLTEVGDAARTIADHLLDAAEVRRAATVACYVSVGSEPGTTALLDRLISAGKRVILPVLMPDNDLDWAVYHGETSLAPAGRGLLEPMSPSPRRPTRSRPPTPCSSRGWRSPPPASDSVAAAAPTTAPSPGSPSAPSPASCSTPTRPGHRTDRAARPHRHRRRLRPTASPASDPPDVRPGCEHTIETGTIPRAPASACPRRHPRRRPG